jgi:hypothetical protein
MSKKTILLALAVAAMFAIPSAASAQEIHISGVTNFTVSGPGGSLVAEGEPKITCTNTGGSGLFEGGSTTGSIILDFTGCTAEFFGIKGNCSTGATVGTIANTGTFHLITFSSKPAVLVTTNLVTITCAGFSKIEVTGNVIGTITSPACAASSKEFGLSFKSSSSPVTQEDELYTGVNYDLKAKTAGGSEVTAGLSGTATLNSTTAGTLECT